VQCEEVRERLLELAEECGEPGVLPGVVEHLSQCPECQAELELLRAGRAALESALLQLAPHRRHLTRRRLRRMRKALAAPGPRRRAPALGALVAFASVTAIIVSGFFIYRSLSSLLAVPPVSESTVAQESQVPGVVLQPVRIGLASSPQQDRLHVVPGYVRAEGTRPQTPAPWEYASQGDLVLTSSPGVHVPVEHIFYDPEQAGYWW